MSKRYVITIGRQFGSGGREIALGLAEKLGIPFYDKALLEKAAEKNGVSEEVLDKTDEKVEGNVSETVHRSLSIMLGNSVDYSTYFDSVNTNDRVFRLKAQMIRELADQGPCVIVGRCADYVLRDDPGLISIFIAAPMAARVERIQKLYPNLHDNAPAALIRQTDKSRANYYNYNTDRKWGSIDNYHLCVDSSRLGVQGTIDMLADYVKNCTKE